MEGPSALVEGPSASVTLEALPVELQQECLKYLPLQDLARASGVNKLLTHAANDASAIAVRSFGLTTNPGDKPGESLRAVYLLQNEITDVRVEYGGREAGIRKFDTSEVVLDAPVLPTHYQHLFPRSTAAIVQYAPSVDGSWYEAFEVVWSSGDGVDARYRVKWCDGDPYEGPVGLAGLRLRAVQPKTLGDLLAGPVLQVLVPVRQSGMPGGGRRWQPGLVRTVTLASGRQLGLDELVNLHSKLDGRGTMPPALARALWSAASPAAPNGQRKQATPGIGDPCSDPCDHEYGGSYRVSAAGLTAQPSAPHRYF